MDKIERREKIKAQLKDKRYRDAFVSEHIDAGISFQIRALRKKKPWTQKELSNRTGMAQERISVAENPNYSRFNIKTLKRIASAFDVAFIGRFVPISELVEWELSLSTETLAPVSFEEDPYFQPPVTNIVGHGGVTVGGEGIVTFSSPDTRAKGTLLYLDARQKKATENKIDADQKEKDTSSYEHLARANQ